MRAKYAGYIKRQQDEIDRQRRNEETRAARRSRLRRASPGSPPKCGRSSPRSSPATVGQAGRIPGVTPAAVSILLVHLKKRSLAGAQPGRMKGFIAQLSQQPGRRNDSLVCVGLDPEIERLPAALAGEPSPIFQFNKAIIDATADLVCAYKPQFAHYAAYEAEDQLERTIEYIHRTLSRAFR